MSKFPWTVEKEHILQLLHIQRKGEGERLMFSLNKGWSKEGNGEDWFKVMF